MDKTLARTRVSKVAPKPSERPSLAVRKAVRFPAFLSFEERQSARL